jgi:ribonuclease HI
MSKAYDRVNIYMLQKAMERIGLPISFITFITNLFTNRQNRIFTAHGTTNSYNVLVGIDQGEVISPLLWCIYYDPLLTKIQKLANENLVGYQLSHTWIQDLQNPTNMSSENCTIPLTAFMDDSHWINDSTEKLERTLEVTDSFNNLNDIQTNDEKAVLLSTRVPKDGQPVTLHIGSRIINITPMATNESTRILGVWITAGKSNQHIIKQIKEEVYACCALLQNKIVTDKQLLYIFNTVIVPRIEFRSQLVFLSKDQCETIQAPFRTLLKHKLHMPKNTPNAILATNMLYQFRDIFHNQIQAKYTALNAQLNHNSLVGVSTFIRLYKLQTNKWLPKNPLICWPANTKVGNKDHIADLLSNLSLFNLSFDLDPRIMNHIKGGTVPLIDVLDTKSYKNAVSSLQYNKILYLSQITSIDGDYLLKWIDTRLFDNHTSIKIPKWFQILETVVTTDSFTTRRLKPQWITQAKPPGNYSPLTLVRNARPREWIAAWNPSTNDAIYGQVCKVVNDEIILTHWKNDYSLQQTSPSHQALFLKKCDGCLLNDPSITEINKYSNIARPTCVTTCLHKDALYVPTMTKKFKNEGAQISISTFALKQLTKHHYLSNHNLPHLTRSVSYPESITLDTNLSHNITSPFPLIEKYIINHEYKARLSTIAHNFSNRNHLIFYSDGSVKRHLHNSHAAAAWIETNSLMQESFAAGVGRQWISSFKAELTAVTTAIITAPPRCKINIYTDSKNVIDTYTRLLAINPFRYPRECLKTKHIDLWYIFFDALYNNNLSLSFHKVKAHNNNRYNEEVDKLAKAHLESPILNFDFSRGLYMVAPKILNYRISTSLRPFIKEISQMQGFFEFINLNRNAKYKTLNVDWNNTFNYVSQDSRNSITSFSNSNKKSKRIKLLLEELPTLQYLQSCKPQVYDASWTCCNCGEIETFAHLWTCPHITSTLQAISDATLHLLGTMLSQIDDKITETNPSVIKIANDPDIWNISHSHDTFTFVDLVKGYVPSSLSTNINKLVNSHKITTATTTSLLNFIFNQVQEHIWLPRCEAVISKEKANNITQKLKISAKNKGSSFLKRSAAVPSHILAKPPFNKYLNNITNLLDVSINNGERFTLFRWFMTIH